MRGSGDGEAGEGPAPVPAFERHETVRDRWDCESVLSLRSNLDNHPASIMEPQSRRRQVRASLFTAAAPHALRVCGCKPLATADCPCGRIEWTPCHA